MMGLYFLLHSHGKIIKEINLTAVDCHEALRYGFKIPYFGGGYFLRHFPPLYNTADQTFRRVTDRLISYQDIVQGSIGSGKRQVHLCGFLFVSHERAQHIRFSFLYHSQCLRIAVRIHILKFQSGESGYGTQDI